MNGYIGIDIQHNRSVVALLETAGIARAMPVGDGRRALVPNSSTAGRWGSAAAEHILDTLPDPTDELRERPLMPWLSDPWSIDFLHGLSDRLAAYLGRISATYRHGYEVLISWPPTGAGSGSPDAATLRERCSSAGLTEITTVHPTDALLCRWLADPMSPIEIACEAIVVAAGQGWTLVTVYHVERSVDRVQIDLGTGEANATLPVGSQALVDRLARTVLERGERAPSRFLLPVMDGVVEYLGMLSDQHGDRELTWQGPLSDRFFAPLGFSVSQIARWPETTRLTRPIADIVRSMQGVGRHVILLGGIGSVGPFLSGALGELGSVWHSTEPELAIAAGATWWPRLHSSFVGTPRTLVSSVLPNPEPGVIGEPGTRPTETEPEIPPWKRD